MHSSALTSKGQVTIPSELRRKLKLQPGDRVSLVLEDDHIVLYRKENRIEAAFGLVKVKRTAHLDDIEKAAQEKLKHDGY